MSEETLSILEEYIRELLEDQEPEIDPSPDAVGLKAHVDDLFSEDNENGEVERLFIQFFVDCSIPSYPQDSSLGYTNADVITQKGVIIANVESRTDPPVYHGDVLLPEEFFEKFDINDRLKSRIERLFDRLTTLATPGETWLDRVSSLYNDRLAGNDGITEPRRVC